MTLRYADSNHRYSMDGRWVPSVTAITKGGLPAPALMTWHANVVADYVTEHWDVVTQLHDEGGLNAHLRTVPDTARNKAASRGTEIHDYAERVVGGERVEVPQRIAREVDGLARLLDEQDIHPVVTEVPVGNKEHWYAGRPDFIGTRRGVPILIDWKSSAGVYGETALQTGAYARAEFYVTMDDPDDEHPLPPVEQIAVVHITPDGSWLYDLGSIDAAFADFLAAKAVYHTMRRIKDLIGEPES